MLKSTIPHASTKVYLILRKKAICHKICWAHKLENLPFIFGWIKIRGLESKNSYSFGSGQSWPLGSMNFLFEVEINS
jgi:hypothetical protein